MAKFKVQIPTEIVRSKEYTDKEFILLAKLIQIYYMIPEDQKSFTFAIKHQTVMFYTGINDNKTFKKAIDGLYEKGVIKNKIGKLPRKTGLEIVLNEDVIPQFSKQIFTQLSSNVLNKNIIDSVGHTGVRLLFFYQSYINTKKLNKNFCYIAEKTTAELLGITEKTVIKYNKLLKKHKLLKIEVHEAEQTLYTTKNGKDTYRFTKYNNHYSIRYDNIDNFGQKSA